MRPSTVAVTRDSATTWRSIGLEECLEPKTRTVDPAQIDDLPYVGLEHLDSGSITISRSGQSADVRSAKTLFAAGDLLYGKLRPYLDKAALADRDGICSTDILVFRTRDGFDSKFMAFRLHGADLRRHATSTMAGVNHPRTSWPKFRTFRFACPPQEEQQAIAHLLSSLHQAREQTEQVLSASSQLKRTLLQHLFTNGTQTNSAEGISLQPTAFGSIPATWQIRSLEDCAVIQGGVTKGRKLAGDVIEVPYLRVANVQDGYLDLSTLKSLPIKSEELNRYRLMRGDVLLTEGGDFDKLGRGHIWRGEVEPCIHQNHIFAVRTDRTQLLPEYLAYLLQSLYGKRYFLKVAHRTTHLASINKTKVRALPVPLPSIAEQERIVSALATIDQKIAVEEQRRDALSELFGTLLLELMTEKRRVKSLLAIA